MQSVQIKKNRPLVILSLSSLVAYHNISPSSRAVVTRLAHVRQDKTEFVLSLDHLVVLLDVGGAVVGLALDHRLVVRRRLLVVVVAHLGRRHRRLLLLLLYLVLVVVVRVHVVLALVEVTVEFVRVQLAGVHQYFVGRGHWERVAGEGRAAGTGR